MLRKRNPWHDPAGNRTTRKPPDHRQETHMEVVWTFFSRSSGLAKSVLQGTARGGRSQGIEEKSCNDNVRWWTGLEFAESQRAAESKGKLRKLVVKSFVVLQRPSWVRDRWRWRWRYNTTWSTSAEKKKKLRHAKSTGRSYPRLPLLIVAIQATSNETSSFRLSSLKLPTLWEFYDLYWTYTHLFQDQFPALWASWDTFRVAPFTGRLVTHLAYRLT